VTGENYRKLSEHSKLLAAAEIMRLEDAAKEKRMEILNCVLDASGLTQAQRFRAQVKAISPYTYSKASTYVLDLLAVIAEVKHGR